MKIKENFERISDLINAELEKSGRKQSSLKIIAVSKTFPPEVVEEAMSYGINIFGESYVQEIVKKYEYFESKRIKQPEWHFIGHLQTNKVKYIAPFIDTIHSVDSLKLAKEIDKYAEKYNKIINILFQVNTSGEASKFGVRIEDLKENVLEIIKLQNIKLIGLMTIAGLNNTAEENRKEFKILNDLLQNLKKENNLSLNELSMGMSSDFLEAIQENSTMVRIGSNIFGLREYKI